MSLLLSRRVDEKIVIIVDDKVIAELMVSGICGNQVRLAFDAPQSTTIHRKEIHNRILKERGN